MNVEHSIQVAGQAQAFSTSTIVLMIAGALMLIILLIIMLAWIAKRWGFARNVTDKRDVVSLVASKSLGPRERLVVIDVGAERLVIGVTATQISYLTTQTRPAMSSQVPAEKGFPKMLEKSRQRYSLESESS